MPVDEGPQIDVATVQSKVNGAAVMAYPDFLKEAAERVGSNFYILPSSIHDVLLMPGKDSPGLAALENMVRQINRTEVAPEDRLSDKVYHYDAKERMLEMGESFEHRMAARQMYAPVRSEAR